jgi:hypothetical protein
VRADGAPEKRGTYAGLRFNAMLATRWPFEFHDIAFRVGDVDGRTFSFSSVPSCQRPRFDVMCLKMRADGRFIERLDAHTEVIEVPSFLRRRRTTGLSKLAIHWHKVKQRAAGAELYQPDEVFATFDGAPERFAVEAKHAIKVDHAQDKVINLANSDHRASDWVANRYVGRPAAAAKTLRPAGAIGLAPTPGLDRRKGSQGMRQAGRRVVTWKWPNGLV